MKTESQDFITLRSGDYARSLSQCPPEVKETPDVDEEPNGVCRICAKVAVHSTHDARLFGVF